MENLTQRQAAILLSERYVLAKNTPSDINEHIDKLKEYADQCQIIYELGVRAVCSTYGLIQSLIENPGGDRRLVSVDIAKYPHVDEVVEIAKTAGILFSFIEADVRTLQLPPCDMCFIDTWHTEEQIEAELKIYPAITRKFLAFHDTTTFAVNGEDCRPGIWEPIMRFLNSHPEWVICYKSDQNNGLTVLKRVS